MATTWKALEPLLHADGRRAAAAVVEAVRRVAQAADRADRTAALDGLVTALGQRPDAGLLRRLGGSEEPFARRVALELVARLPAVPGEVVPELHPLLRQRKLPGPLKLAAGAAFLRAASDPETAAAALRSFVAGHGKSKARDRVVSLRRRVRGTAALKELCDRWLDRLSMPCPVCDARLPRPELVKHLWDAHRMTLDGTRAVEPWRAVESALDDYARAGDPAALDRACELARRLDPEGGLARAHRELLRRGVSDAEAVSHLARLAAVREEALCPHCFAGVSAPSEPHARPLALAPGRLAGHGYEADLTGGGLLTRLVARTPVGLAHIGAEPGLRFSPAGLQWLLVTPLVLLALALAIFWPLDPLPTDSGLVLLLRDWTRLPAGILRWIPGVAAVFGTLALAVVADVWLRLRMRSVLPPAERAVDHAWGVLVPRLLAGDLPGGSDFVAGLAVVTAGRGTPARREVQLTEMLTRTRASVAAGEPPARLAALAWLEAADAPARGRDRVLVLADHAAAGLIGDEPPGLTELLLGDDRLREWSDADRARLRVLLAGHAFAAGLGVSDLRELARVMPPLGTVLHTDDPDGLARLLLLWSLRNQKPWQECGPAVAAFDLARYPALGGQHLRDRPDLLLFQPTADGVPEGGAPSPILVCGSGVVFRGQTLTRVGQVRVAGWSTMRGGYELHIGEERFAFHTDPTDLAKRLERWVKFLSGEFLPKTEAMRAVRNPTLLRKLLARWTRDCPECGRRFVGRAGAVGMPIREAKPAK